MGFASEYLRNRLLFEPFLDNSPSRNTSIIVTIPAFDEPDICQTLDSLSKCIEPDCGVEVIIHINAPGKASEEQLRRTIESENIIKSWMEVNKPFFQLFFLNTGLNKVKDWGAGMARKVVMDEALSRFNTISQPDGVIASLDADCRVTSNYFTGLYEELYCYKNHNACSIYFEHPLEGPEFSQDVYDAVTSYELYLRYYYQSLKLSGFPWVFHTVGSAFAVKAETYHRAGGMGRNQAGEDFYFIQKVIPMGGYFYLRSIKIAPSPRASERVPFGTGPVIRSLISGEISQYYTYNPNAFICLRSLFLNVSKMYRATEEILDSIEDSLSENPRSFLINEKWRERLLEINSNTSTEAAFVKRFFNWFNMFKVVKYLNWSHTTGSFEKVIVSNAALKILGLLGNDSKPGNDLELLQIYRELEV